MGPAIARIARSNISTVRCSAFSTSARTISRPLRRLMVLSHSASVEWLTLILVTKHQSRPPLLSARLIAAVRYASPGVLA